MSAPDRLPDEVLDGLLDGSPSEEAAGSPLAAYLSALRDDAQATAPAPSVQLQTLLAEGLDPAELEAAEVEGSPARGGVPAWRRRVNLLRGAVVTKLAAVGMLTKVAAAGAAVTVAASGAGAAGVLPAPAQDAFDDVVGRQVQDVPTEADEQVEAGDTADVDDAAEVPPQLPADTSTTPPLETDVPGAATDRDGEPGVDGADVADDASDGRSRAPDETPAEIKRSEKARSQAANENADDARDERVPGEAPPAEAPSSDGAPAREDEPPPTANQDDAGDRSTSSSRTDLTDRGSGS